MLSNITYMLIGAGISTTICYLFNHFANKRSKIILEEEYNNKHSQEKDITVHKLNDTFHTGSEMLEQMTGSLLKIRELIASTSGPIQIIFDSGNNAHGMMTEAQSAVSNMENTLTLLMDELGSLTEKLHDHLLQVNSKTQVIHNIAKQANLLSLNAAIEAARVGEMGQGFAVVANDMTRLSDISASAAQDISKILSCGLTDIETIRSEMDDKINSVTSATSQILGSFEKMNNSILSISALTNSLKNESLKTEEEVKLVSDKSQTVMESMTKMLSDVVGNLSGNIIKDISPRDAKNNLHNFNIIDVRAPNEFNDDMGHIDNAKFYPLDDKFKESISHLEKNANYLFICRSGGRSARAARIAQAIGFNNVSNLNGGMLKWREFFPQ